MTKGQIIKRAIKNSGKTQEEVAKMSGFNSQSNIAMIIKNPDSGIEKVRKILNSIGYRIEVTNGYDRWELDGIEEVTEEEDRKNILKRVKKLSSKEYAELQAILDKMESGGEK